MASWFSTWLGIALIGFGIWGLFSGAHDHELYVIGVNGVLNMVHLLSGALVLVAALAGNRMAKLALLGVAVLFGTLAGAGFGNVTAVTEQLNMNPANHVAYAGLAVLALIVGLGSRSD
jgi:hypothetical protein